MEHLISTQNISKEDLLDIFNLSALEEELFLIYNDKLKSKILVTLFWQDSLRTQMSFKSSFMRLGGNCISYNAKNSIERVEDIAKFISNYGDIIVARSDNENDIIKLVRNATIPVISAGHGMQEHPTSSIGEAYLINKYFNSLENLNILFFGYLPNRTFNSLVLLLEKFKNNKFHIVSSTKKENTLYKDRDKFKYYTDLDDLRNQINTKNIDIIYIGEHKNNYKNPDLIEIFFDKRYLHYFRKDVYITHNLPIIKILDRDIDNFKNAQYLKRPNYTKFIRASIFLKYFN